MTRFKVGIITQTLVQQHHLRETAEACGCTVEGAWLIEQLLKRLDSLANQGGIDIWLVDVDTFSLEQTKTMVSFERWLFNLKVPVIFGEGNSYNATEDGFNSWMRQITSKLLSTCGRLYLQQERQQSATAVWVLAASTGGPEAVKRFLDPLPKGLGIAFLYVQHIESQQHSSVVSSVTRDSQYTGRVAQHGDILCADSVTIVPAHQELDVLADGTLMLRDTPWGGEYKPSIDKVVGSIAERFGSRGGAIFFSGMGDDGVVGARLLSRRSGQVWIQSLSSCTSDSMPAAIKKTDCVTVTGTPEQLSGHLVDAFSATKETASV